MDRDEFEEKCRRPPTASSTGTSGKRASPRPPVRTSPQAQTGAAGAEDDAAREQLARERSGDLFTLVADPRRSLRLELSET